MFHWYDFCSAIAVVASLLSFGMKLNKGVKIEDATTKNFHP